MSPRRVVIVPVLALVGLAFGLLVGCRVAGPSEPVAQTSDACCTVTSKDRQRSAGCRVADRCRADEAVWMRGAITCGPVEPERCKGGRCCRFLSREEQAGPVRDWESDAPISGGLETPQTPATQPTPETVPAPAPPGTDADQAPPETM